MFMFIACGLGQLQKNTLEIMAESSMSMLEIRTRCDCPLSKNNSGSIYQSRR